MTDAHVPSEERLYSEADPDLVLEISFETAVWIANSLPREDQATKALKRLIRSAYDAKLGLDE